MRYQVENLKQNSKSIHAHILLSMQCRSGLHDNAQYLVHRLVTLSLNPQIDHSVG